MSGYDGRPAVIEAVRVVEDRTFDVHELFEQATSVLSGLLGVGFAVPVPGCCAGLALCSLALGEVLGCSPRDLVIATDRSNQHTFSRCLEAFGPRVAAVDLVRESVGAGADGQVGRVDAFLHVAGRDPGTDLPRPAALERVRSRRLPLLVDAAGSVYPLERMRSAASSGADFVVFSGKYIGSLSNSGVLVAGDRWREAVLRSTFLGLDYYDRFSPGRTLKLDRVTMWATVVALRNWMSADHAERIARQDRCADIVLRHVAEATGTVARYSSDPRGLFSEVLVGGASVQAAGPGRLMQALRERPRPIAAHRTERDLAIRVGALSPEEAEIVGQAIVEALEPYAAGGPDGRA